MTPGRLGSYPIERELGRGGMGVVYLGRDPRLDRPVAVKIIPAALAQNPDNLARFEREAKLLAAVTHPNIAAVYGVEEAEGQRLLVMEYVPGETLSEHLRRGPLPVHDALEVARQIASAVEAAHDAGIIHRDLKPGNVKVAPDGSVKVLDFGLAKSGAASSADLAQSPTLTYSPTAMGVILGTAGYMSPEQARGKPVDRRADIWAFGCVLFECLTGQKIFEAETASDTIARVIEREPDWDSLPPATPSRIKDLLRHCLEKDVKKRQRDIGDVRLEIEDVLAQKSSGARNAPDAAASVKPALGRRALVALLLLAVGAAAGIAVWARARPAPAGSVLSFYAAIPPDTRYAGVSFDGDSDVLFSLAAPKHVEGATDGPNRLYRRTLDSFEWTVIRGTEGATDFGLYPDQDKWLFVLGTNPNGDRRLWKATVDGSSPSVPLVDYQRDWDGLELMRNGDILLRDAANTKFFRLLAPTWAVRPAVAFDLGDNKLTGRKLFQGELPNGVVMLRVDQWAQRGFQTDIWLMDPSTGKAHRILESAGNPWYLPSGHLLYAHGATIMAASLNLSNGTLGEAVPLFEGLRTVEGYNGSFSLSKSGHLAFTPGGIIGNDRRLVMITPSRDVSALVPDHRQYEGSLSNSPDGSKIAVDAWSGKGYYELWTPTPDGSGLTRLLADSRADIQDAKWSPDKKWLAFSRVGRDGKDGVYVKAADGSGAPKLVLKSDEVTGVWLHGWTHDSSAVIVTRFVNGTGDIVTMSISASGDPGTESPLLVTPSAESQGAETLDGKLIAFVSDENTRDEVYVARMSAGRVTGPHLKVSSHGGGNPIWADHRLYFGANARVMYVDIDASAAELKASTPVLAYDLEALKINNWTILPNGRLVGTQRGAGEEPPTSYGIVLNWLDSVRAKLPQR